MPAAAARPPSILATAVIPWTADYVFDELVFRRQVETIAKGLTRKVYIFGTAGEGYAVCEAQFDRVAAAFRRAATDFEVSPILGIISLSLSAVIQRIERGCALGFREFQISLPAWGALNDAELDRYFAETCGRFPDCSFHHYNLGRTKRILTSIEYRRLAAAHPNLVAVKSSTDDPAIVADLLTVSPRLRFYFTEFGYTIARAHGADVGLLISLASANYARALAFVSGDDAGRVQAAGEMRRMAASLRAIAADRFHIDGAYDKMLFRLHDSGFPLRLLPPYSGATEAEFERFRTGLPPGWNTSVSQG